MVKNFSLIFKSIKNLFHIKYFYYYLFIDLGIYILLKISFPNVKINSLNSMIDFINNDEYSTIFIFTASIFSYILLFLLIKYFILSLHNYFKIHCEYSRTPIDLFSFLLIHSIKVLILGIILIIPLKIYDKPIGTIPMLSNTFYYLIGFIIFSIFMFGLVSHIVSNNHLKSFVNALKLVKSKFLIYALMLFIIFFVTLPEVSQFFYNNLILEILKLIIRSLIFPFSFVILVTIIKKSNYEF